MKQFLSFLCISFIVATGFAQQTITPPIPNFDGLKFRSIGPAFMSGRIADIAVHPNNPNIWYVAVGSGGVWKTVNAGTTWAPLFDGQPVYSVGCITLDPTNPEVIWVGTGENVGGRHVAFGAGVYRSTDGGKTWENKGLPQSNHISKIVVHPSDPNTVWVAAQGPLWSAGGERGVFKSTDAGATWKRVLGDAAWVGATDLLIDPRNPDLLYAATWQRHRTVAGYMGGGPGTAIYRTNNGGNSWEKLTTGLPSSQMGKIGLALSPQQPDVVYAAIELDRRSGGVYRSSNRGASWEKMSDAVSGGTGPHYYQELYACPHQFDRIYLADNYMQVSADGGKTFVRMNETSKHIDNHAVAFQTNNPDYLLVGTDGGLYETFDRTKTWRFVGNLPVTQFYKIAVDDAAPFYNIYGGTQDNSTQGGPSRTVSTHGIRNSDWFVVVGGDGHQPATEPGNPDIVYGQSQQGYLVRHDRKTGENVAIRPLAAPGDPTERFNWDAPILVSPHNAATIYFASQRVWKSENRGDSWTPISADLTKNVERLNTPFFGAIQSWDSPWDVYAMSNYSTITSLAASPKQQGLLYAGTDDGLLQVSENEGAEWRTIELGSLPGLPATAFVNDIKADLFDAQTVYLSCDNHKMGDLQPYFYKSTNKGKTWVKLTDGLPAITLVWRMVQDPVAPQLLFLATEFGVYVSVNGGKNWQALKGGMPPIGVRDMAIQKRENDLVIGTFGRGIYILDDYSALRDAANLNAATAVLYPPRSAWSYHQKQDLGGSAQAFQGDAYFMAPNPAYGAVFTYFLKTDLKGAKELRQQSEKSGAQKGFVGWDTVDKELQAPAPAIWLCVSDTSGQIIRRIAAANTAGYNRIAWDLTATWAPAIGKATDNGMNWPVAAGSYFGQLFSVHNGAWAPLSAQVQVTVQELQTPALSGVSNQAKDAFKAEVVALQAGINLLNRNYESQKEQLELVKKAVQLAKNPTANIYTQLHQLQNSFNAFDAALNGSPARKEMRNIEAQTPIFTYLYTAMGGARNTYGPTGLQQQSLEYGQQELERFNKELAHLATALAELQPFFDGIGAPQLHQPGR